MVTDVKIANLCLKFRHLIVLFYQAFLKYIISVSFTESLTCVVVPDSHFGQISQTEHISKSKRVHLLAFKFVGLVAVLQHQGSRVAVLPKNNQPDVGICASRC